ncbi:hypothetical protein [Sorangium sp. So ce1389]|uniref:hypothetical protein n=1 Tax=Sorangium sp. So ce1389 TaxID=3133336 RepID=UPI003F639727
MSAITGCAVPPEIGDCAITEEGVSAMRTCSPRMGTELFPCLAGTSCELDEEGFPICAPDAN